MRLPLALREFIEAQKRDQNMSLRLISVLPILTGLIVPNTPYHLNEEETNSSIGTRSVTWTWLWLY